MTAEQKRKKPVFHEAPPDLKQDFVPHQVGENEILTAQEEEPHVEKQEVQQEEKTPVSEPAQGEPQSTLRNGWQLITPEQHTGEAFFVANDLEEEGVRAFWRKTRVLSHNKWTTHGKWSLALNRLDVLPEPRYYKEIG